MILSINGKQETVEGAMTVDALVASKKLCPEKIVLEHNFHILSREDWSKVALRDGDTVEIVSFVGGG